MAMNLGPSLGANDEDEVIGTINTTPLVDVMLVLLIIFLITIPVVTTSIKVDLPKEARPGGIWGPECTSEKERKTLQALWQHLRHPVVQMTAALCGHPDSVSFWEDKCNKEVCEVGFESLGSEWPSVFYHKELKLLLTIYVDDFKLAGPEENLEKGWALLRQKIEIGPTSRGGCIWDAILLTRKLHWPMDNPPTQSSMTWNPSWNSASAST